MEIQKCKNSCKKAFDYMKQHLTSIIVGIIILVASALYLLLLYQKGNENQSNNIVDFNGFFLPILTAINIFVFIRLTNKIDQNNKQKHENNLEIQIKLHLFNVRNVRIKELNEAFIKMRNELHNNEMNREELISNLYNIRRIILSNFSKSNLFMTKAIQKFIDIKSRFYQLTESYCIGNFTPTQFNSIKDDLFDESFNIVQALENFTLAQLKTNKEDSAFTTMRENVIENTKMSDVIKI